MAQTTFEIEKAPDVEIKERTALLEKELLRIANLERIDSPERLEAVLKEATEVLQNEGEEIRPQDERGKPGGLVELRKDIPTLALHDIHGDRQYLLKSLFERDGNGRNNLEKMMAGELQIVSLGNGLHTEKSKNAEERWREIGKEARNNFSPSPYMDAEMADSFGVMEMVMILKTAAPNSFHYVRGNHDNITEIRLRKFHAPLNILVNQYLSVKYTPDFAERYHEFEESLPIAAVGRNLVLSHAEPMEEYSQDQIINIKSYPHLLEKMTWTRDFETETFSETTSDDATIKTLRNLLPEAEAENAVWLGGHTYIKKPGADFETGINERFIRFYNLSKMNVALINPDHPFNPEKDIHDVSNVGIRKEAIPESLTVEGSPSNENFRKFKEGAQVRIVIETPFQEKKFERGWKVVGKDEESGQILLEEPGGNRARRLVSEKELSEWNS